MTKRRLREGVEFFRFLTRAPRKAARRSTTGSGCFPGLALGAGEIGAHASPRRALLPPRDAGIISPSSPPDNFVSIIFHFISSLDVNRRRYHGGRDATAPSSCGSASTASGVALHGWCGWGRRPPYTVEAPLCLGGMFPCSCWAAAYLACLAPSFSSSAVSLCGVGIFLPIVDRRATFSR